jgi:hypothetical protein
MPACGSRARTGNVRSISLISLARAMAGACMRGPQALPQVLDQHRGRISDRPAASRLEMVFESPHIPAHADG